ncbi:MAG: hypothetical protein Q8L20_14305 [Gammaproteobacteria bacterium]|nr:hypothetical protein [Gammaproteobacteria bacterium]
MKKQLFRYCLALLPMTASAADVAFEVMTLSIPDSWKIEGSILHDGSGDKVGEVVSKNSWPYSSGEEFVASFREGFVDDLSTTEFISSGTENEIHWVCRTGESWDGRGNARIWFARTFWVNGPVIVLYSGKSCDDDFPIALEIAKTLNEN